MATQYSIIIIALLGYFCGCESAIVRFRECSSSSGKTGTLHSVDVDPCPGAPAGCKLVRGTKPTITITFTPNSASENVTSVVHGIVAGLPVEFPLPNPNGCVNSGLSCPLVKGKKYSYVQKLPILKQYPKAFDYVRNSTEVLSRLRFRRSVGGSSVHLHETTEAPAWLAEALNGANTTQPCTTVMCELFTKVKDLHSTSAMHVLVDGHLIIMAVIILVGIAAAFFTYYKKFMQGNRVLHKV